MLAIGVAKMKTLTINGVPYSVNEKQELFLYSSSPPIRIGSYEPLSPGKDSSSQKISIDSDWKTKSQAFLTQYRTSLAQSTAAALEKAAALQNS
jgi:hypothetical protein